MANGGGKPILSVSVAVCSRGRPEQLRRLAGRLRDLIDESGLEGCNLIVIEDISEAARAPTPVGAADIYQAISEKGQGFGAIRQHAVQACDRDILVFIDDDCIPGDEWLHRMAAPFLDDEVVAAGGGILPQRGNAVACATALLGLPGGGLPRLIEAGEHEQPSEHLSAGNLALRRAAVEAAGGFDSRHHHGGEDQQLIASLSGKKLFLPAAVVEHRNREQFDEVWHWFVRRGRGEYRVNRLTGMSRFEALLTPLQWSWSWRLLLLLLVTARFGIGWGVTLVVAYYMALAARTYLANRRSSPLQEVEARRRDCLTPEAVAIAPALRLCMDFGREAGRISAYREDREKQQ